MTETPSVEPGEWIVIRAVRAVVSRVYADRTPAEIEVVYLDGRNRALYKDVVWRDNHWEFTSGLGGGSAENDDRLARYLRLLRSNVSTPPGLRRRKRK